jgi:hypothetical protein
MTRHSRLPLLLLPVRLSLPGMVGRPAMLVYSHQNQSNMLPGSLRYVFSNFSGPLICILFSVTFLDNTFSLRFKIIIVRTKI